MTNYKVYEGSSVDDELENNDKIKVNDTIEYITNNQEGYEKYKVVLVNGKKDLELISTYDDLSDDEMDYDYMGGKKRTNRKRTNRKRTNRKRTNSAQPKTH